MLELCVFAAALVVFAVLRTTVVVEDVSDTLLLLLTTLLSSSLGGCSSPRFGRPAAPLVVTVGFLAGRPFVDLACGGFAEPSIRLARFAVAAIAAVFAGEACCTKFGFRGDVGRGKGFLFGDIDCVLEGDRGTFCELDDFGDNTVDGLGGRLDCCVAFVLFLGFGRK